MCNGNGDCVGCITAANCPAGNDCQRPSARPAAFAASRRRRVHPGERHDGPVTATPTSATATAGSARSSTRTTRPRTTETSACRGLQNGGAPAVIPQSSGFACTTGTGAKCDGAGACVECLGPSECPGDDDECSPRTCIPGVCGTQITPLNTPVTVQVSGDCKDSICDGLGGVRTMNNNSDPPTPTNECMTPACSAGNVTLTPKPHGTTCPRTTAAPATAPGACRLTFNVVRVGDGVTTRSRTTLTTALHRGAGWRGRRAERKHAPATDRRSRRSVDPWRLSGPASGPAPQAGKRPKWADAVGDGKYVTLGGYNRMTADHERGHQRRQRFLLVGRARRRHRQLSTPPRCSATPPSAGDNLRGDDTSERIGVLGGRERARRRGTDGWRLLLRLAGARAPETRSSPPPTMPATRTSSMASCTSRRTTSTFLKPHVQGRHLAACHERDR